MLFYIRILNTRPQRRSERPKNIEFLPNFVELSQVSFITLVYIWMISPISYDCPVNVCVSSLFVIVCGFVVKKGHGLANMADPVFTTCIFARFVTVGFFY